MDEEWKWSDEHRDYYRYRQRDRAGKSTYDIVWGRTSIEPPPIASQVPVAPAIPATPSGPLYTSAFITPYADTYPTPTSTHGQNQPPWPVTQPIRQSPVNQTSVPPGLAHRARSPVSNYHIPPFGVLTVQAGLNAGTSYDSSASTEGTRTMTPTTSADTQSSPLSVTAPAIDSANVPRSFVEDVASVHDGDLETSVILTDYLTQDSYYETIRNPQRYFKKGRVFKVVWLEPRGEPFTSSHEQPILNQIRDATAPATTTASDTASTLDTISTLASVGSTQAVHAKPRLFVVVRQKARHCLCLPIYTYSQQATSKTGVNPEDHAPLVLEGGDVKFHPQEQQERLKKRLFLVLEDSSVQWQPMSRINFGKVQTVEYNLKVRTVGRIAAGSMADLETSFREGIGLGDE